MTALGVPGLAARPTVVIGGPTPVTATIVGVVREGYGEELVTYRVDRSAGPWDDAGAADPATAMYSGASTLELSTGASGGRRVGRAAVTGGPARDADRRSGRASWCTGSAQRSSCWPT